MFTRFPFGACLILALIAAPGCAPHPSAATVDRLSKRVGDLAGQVRLQRQSLDELASRLVVLQDRVDANRVGISRRAARPRPAASPRPVARPASPPPPRRATPAPSRIRRRLPVVKLRAGRPARHRPRGRKGRPGKTIVLKLTGSPDPRPAGQRGRAPLAPLPTVGERLPVVAMPGAPVARGGRLGAELEYRQAHGLFRKRAYAQAGKAFSRMAKRFPKHALADNATYWLAECFFRKGQIRRAAWVLRQLLKRYPAGNKAPSAMLKLALCEGRLGRRARARKVLAQVMQLYPGSREARLAAARLKRLP